MQKEAKQGESGGVGTALMIAELQEVGNGSFLRRDNDWPGALRSSEADVAN